jgi:hypothetical protein
MPCYWPSICVKPTHVACLKTMHYQRQRLVGPMMQSRACNVLARSWLIGAVTSNTSESLESQFFAGFQHTCNETNHLRHVARTHQSRCTRKPRCPFSPNVRRHPTWSSHPHMHQENSSTPTLMAALCYCSGISPFQKRSQQSC